MKELKSMNLKSLLKQEISAISRIPIERLEEFIASIKRSLEPESKIVTSGMGKAGQISHTLATTLSSTGTPSIFLHPSEAQHGDLGIIQPKDVLILFTNSGKTREIQELISLVHELEYQNPIFVITGESNPYLNLKCSDVFEFGKVEEICPLGLTPTTSTTCMSVISDLIVVDLMRSKNFTTCEYYKRHHGGYLGEKSKDN
jgi:arabinose-5-phosphate isomerase